VGSSDPSEIPSDREDRNLAPAAPFMTAFQAAVVLGILAILAYALKGATGLGPALIMVPIGSFLVGNARIVIVSTFLDLLSGLGLALAERNEAKPRKLGVLLGVTVIGSIVGVLALSTLASRAFTVLFACLLLVSGFLLLIMSKGRSKELDRKPKPVTKVTGMSILVCLFSSVTGGLTGINGPPLAAYFGRFLPPVEFRRTIVPLLLVSAFTRCTGLAIAGEVDVSIVVLIVACLPGMALGLRVGNRLLSSMRQSTFQAVLGVIVIVAAMSTLVKG
jgi:uncharacterized protein